jgi:hypothetical protein
MTLCIPMSVNNFILWDCGLWHSVNWRVWTSLLCETVGYDTLYTDECEQFYFVRLWVMTLFIMTSLNQLTVWDCGVWHFVYWRMWTILFCEIVGYDTLYNDECGPVYYVRLWVMTLHKLTIVNQFIVWDCGLWHSVNWLMCTILFCEIVGYDNLYNEKCEPIHIVGLCFMINCILASVSQFIIWTAGLRQSTCWKMWTYLDHEYRGNIFILRSGRQLSRDTVYRREKLFSAQNPTQIFAHPFQSLICASTVHEIDQQDAPLSH